MTPTQASPGNAKCVQDDVTLARRGRPPLRFLRTKETPKPSNYPLYSIDRAMEQAGVRALPDRASIPDCLPANLAYKFRWMWNFHRAAAGPVFVSYMGYLEKKTFPFSYWTEIVPYCFDCWPKYYDWWTSFYKRQRVRVAFISARQSAEYFAKTMPEMQSVWLPEAVDPSEYRASKPWAERDIDVLEMGRKYSLFHNRIAGKLAESKRVHLHQRTDGEVIFPHRNDLVDGLSRTRIMICFPRCQTHPEDTGNVETVTYRYFQSMASKCLIVGHAPQELIDLFGYNPVIETEAGCEAEHIEWVLDHPDSYGALIERNYARLLEVGTWRSRVERILDVIGEHPAFS
jgi:hypothetical protein